MFKGSYSRFEYSFPLVSRSTPENSMATILDTALAVLDAMKSSVSGFMFKRTLDVVLKAEGKVGENP